MRGKYAESTRSADTYSPRILRVFSVHSPRIFRARGECAENTRRMRVSPRDFPQAVFGPKIHCLWALSKVHVWTHKRHLSCVDNVAQMATGGAQRTKFWLKMLKKHILNFQRTDLNQKLKNNWGLFSSIFDVKQPLNVDKGGFHKKIS